MHLHLPPLPPLPPLPSLRAFDYCTPTREETNLGCLCKAVWTPPQAPGSGGNSSRGRKPYSVDSNAVIGGKCKDVPTEDGSTAGGAWCYTVENTCSNNPKASDLPTYEGDFDYCGPGNAVYQSLRERLLPLDRAAAEGLPPVPATPAYAFARSKGVAALGGYVFTTQSGCRCSPWSWTFFDTASGAPNGTYIGCADPDPSRVPLGAWCPVDPRECNSYFSAFTAGRGADAKMVYYDYCGEVRSRTTAGCLCQVRGVRGVGWRVFREGLILEACVR